MTAAELIGAYPRLYHMAEEGTWASIRRHGLLSTSALLDLFEVHGARRSAIETKRRPETVTLDHSTHGRAIIRDNKPMSDAGLRKCLVGMTPEDWYRLLNSKVFFWVSRERLERLLAARAYRGRRHCVITVETEALIARESENITLSAINSGCTLFRPPKRGPFTFIPIADYPTGNRAASIVELAVEHAVTDVDRVAVSAFHAGHGQPSEHIWTKPR